MTIASLQDYKNSLRQWSFMTGRNGAAVGSSGDAPFWIDFWKGNGNGAPITPAAGAGPGNTSNGVVPTNLTTGAMVFSDFTGLTGYLWSLERNQGQGLGLSTAYNPIMIYDRLFHVGTFTWANPGTFTLSSQPSYASRIPGGDYTGTLILFEAITATGAVAGTVIVKYTDQDGNPGAVSQTLSLAAPQNDPGNTAYIVGFAAGDSGVQKIEEIDTTGPTTGTFDVVVIRPIWLSGLARTSQNVQSNFAGNFLNYWEWATDTMLPTIPPAACLSVLSYQAQSNAGAASESDDLNLEIAAL